MMSDLDAVRRFALSPDNGMMYEAERGGWVRHGDVAATIERLTAELAAARETARRLMDAERVLLAERDAARDDGMRASASILDAEHAKRSHLDNHAASYARMIREHIGKGK
jgi:hypothetical protein